MTGLEAVVAARVGALDLRAALHVAPGETVAVLGPNGAGKTTLLRVLAGLLPLEEGTVVIGGRVVDEPATRTWVPPEERSVGVVFQDYVLFPHLTAVDNVAFGLRARGRSRADARDAALAWLDRMGLAAMARRRPAELSGGMAQRVALARALAPAPGVLLLDEPLAALDASTRVETRRLLRRHLSEHPGARVVVTHDPIDAMALADRLVVLEEGRVVQAGTAEEISRQPRSRYVADLVGVNLVRGEVRHGVLHAPGGGHLAAAGAPADGPAFAVVHPRAVALHARRPEGTPRNVWAGRVSSIDPEGDRSRVAVDGPVPIVAEVTTAAVAELGLVSGGEVWVSLKATEVAVFPA